MLWENRELQKNEGWSLPPVATMNRELADKVGLRDGDALRVVQDGGDAVAAVTAALQ